MQSSTHATRLASEPVAAAQLTSKRATRTLVDNRPKTAQLHKLQSMLQSSPKQAKQRQRALMGQVPIQRMDNGEIDAINVPESKYIALAGQELNSQVVVTGVASCAVIKMNVFVEDELKKTIVFHSDGTDRSTERIDNLVGEITSLRNKGRVSLEVLSITNASAKASGLHNAILAEILKKVKQFDGTIHTAQSSLYLFSEAETMDIDVTGDKAAIEARYNRLIKSDTQEEDDFKPKQRTPKQIERAELIAEYEKLHAKVAKHNRGAKSAKKVGLMELPKFKASEHTNEQMKTRIAKVKKRYKDKKSTCVIS